MTGENAVGRIACVKTVFSPLIILVHVTAPACLTVIIQNCLFVGTQAQFISLFSCLVRTSSASWRCAGEMLPCNVADDCGKEGKFVFQGFGSSKGLFEN